MGRGVRGAVAAGALLAGVAVGTAGTPSPALADEGTDGGAQPALSYPGDPDAESALVAAEDERLTEVRTVGSLASWTQNPLKSPYRLATGAAYTLVLTSRSQPYTIDDLLALAPQTFVRRPDGAYLLSENLVIESGATLNLADPGGLRLLLASDAQGFVSIVNYGGRLNIAGADGAPAQITSFDRSSERPDRRTTDGRAYLRSIGGQVSIADTELSDLGFWSGRTGGLSLTGTDRPNSGSLYDLADSLKVGAVGNAAPDVEGNKNSPLGQVLPAGDLPVPSVDVDAPEYSYVSAAISDTTVSGNAFGIFVSGANGLDVRNSTFDGSLVSGIVLHRYVVNAVIEKSEATGNAEDGIVLARATTGIVLSQVTASDNHRNGVTMSGLPLATGPSATGTSLASYGNNALSNSQVSQNGRYGVEVIGGSNVSVLANDINANEVGVVVRDVADGVDVVGNNVSDSATQGIALRDGVVGATVSGNIVTGGVTSVYVRDAVAAVGHNTLSGATNHAVSMVGDVGTSSLQENTISGHGPSAVETERAHDLDTTGWRNDTSGWQDTTPFLVTLKRFAQPLTVLWILLAALLLFSAVRGARSRGRKAHPYADKRPVSDGIAVTGTERVPEGVGA
ncbi:right-handed parallel beta-helix repeat-containing protein [uncultured Nocardioides sp.]|uniref:right-handed parallel beta-helix repeat-containing protein n=1 Tax=uncultured Nocardioides sp. TaxID=198441 RepID=UPI0026394799|nr:right-handed parallel beta-helix repeat-containing protein [uncultured Nocardioides sp.]